MKKSKIVSAIAALALVPALHAQPVKLDGFSLGLNWNFPSTSVDFNIGGLTGNKSNDSNHGGIQAAYSFSGAENVLLAVGGTYSPGELKAGTVSINNVNYDWTGKELFSLYFEPAVALSPTTLAYGKLSFNTAQGEVMLSNGQTSKDDYTGYGFGLGLRTMLNTNVYLQAEVMQVNYNEKSTLGLTAKPSTTSGALGIGYLF
jgi:opacity protein-like surface antigen